MMKRLAACLAILAIGLSSASAQPFGRTTSNQSAVITMGNTFQTILAAGNRNSLTIQNNNATDSCWIAFGTRTNGTAITAGTATKAESILLLAGGAYTRYWPFIPTDAIQATCASNSDSLYIDIQ